jgi:hypothetical protein
MRRRLLVTGVLVIVLAGCARGSATSLSSSSPSAVVPWLPTPATHHRPLPSPPSPRSPIPVPAGTPPCTARQLEAAVTFGGAAGGHVSTPVILRNRGVSACSLQGLADVGVVDAAGSLLAQALGAGGGRTFFPDGPVVPVLMEPGTAPLRSGEPVPGEGERGQAWMNLDWYDCRHRQAALVLVDLPAGGGRISAPYSLTTPYWPVCDSPGHGADSGLLRGPLSPSGLQPPPVLALIAVAITIAAPAPVRRGSTARYTVALLNRSQADYRLDPCPDYAEILGQKQAMATYQLNCGPVGTLKPGASATFEMHLAVPATLAPGTMNLSWSLDDGRLELPVAATTVTVL